MKLSNEFKVGVLTIITVALLVLGYNFLKGTTLLRKGKLYTIEYSYIPGLKKGDPIQIKGYQIGRVSDIVLAGAQSGRIDVIVNVTEDIDIPVDSRAVIRSADLLGEKYIDLQLGSSSDIFKDGDRIQGNIEADLTNQIKDELKPLTEKVQSMIVSLDTAITVMSSIFTPSFKADFETSVSNIKQTLESFNSSANVLEEVLVSEQVQIERIITDVSSITQNVDANEKNLNEIIANLRNLSDSLSTIDWVGTAMTIDSAMTSLNEILTEVNNGEGTLGKLIYDQELYNNLEKLSVTLDLISKELQANPGKYVPPLIQIGGKKEKE